LVIKHLSMALVVRSFLHAIGCAHGANNQYLTTDQTSGPARQNATANAIRRRVPEIFISGLVVAPCQAGIGAGFKLIGK
jgi:hypothetical protein